MECVAMEQKKLAYDSYMKRWSHSKRSKNKKAQRKSPQMKYHSRNSVHHLEHYDLWEKMGFKGEERLSYTPSTMKVDGCAIGAFNQNRGFNAFDRHIIFVYW